MILAIVPFGFLLFRKVEEALREKYHLTFPEIDIVCNPSQYRNSEWVLFQEQYDRKSGDHQGTSFYILSEDEYLIVSYTHEQLSDSFLSTNIPEIVIPYPGKMMQLSPEKFLWAHLIRKNDNWHIQNERIHTIIPVYETINDYNLKDGSVRFCTPQNLMPTMIQNGDYFIVHTTEFRIFRLPKLALYKIISDKSRKFIKSIYGETVSLDHNGDIVVPEQASIKFGGNFVSVSHDITILYYSKFLPEKSFTNGTFVLPVYPGDFFEIQGSSLKIIIDFDLNAL